MIAQQFRTNTTVRKVVVGDSSRFKYVTVRKLNRVQEKRNCTILSNASKATNDDFPNRQGQTPTPYLISRNLERYSAITLVPFDWVSKFELKGRHEVGCWLLSE